VRGRRRRDILSSNVFDVATYDSIDDVPEDYRPGSPFHHFRQDLEIIVLSEHLSSHVALEAADRLLLCPTLLHPALY
jgi:hypothetical protein